MLNLFVCQHYLWEKPELQEILRECTTCLRCAFVPAVSCSSPTPASPQPAVSTRTAEWASVLNTYSRNKPSIETCTWKNKSFSYKMFLNSCSQPWSWSSTISAHFCLSYLTHPSEVLCCMPVCKLPILNCIDIRISVSQIVVCWNKSKDTPTVHFSRLES